MILPSFYHAKITIHDDKRHAIWLNSVFQASYSPFYFKLAVLMTAKHQETIITQANIICLSCVVQESFFNHCSDNNIYHSQILQTTSYILWDYLLCENVETTKTLLKINISHYICKKIQAKIIKTCFNFFVKK